LDGMKHSCNTLDTQRSACADESPNRCDWNRYRFFQGFFSGSARRIEVYSVWNIRCSMRIISLFSLEIAKNWSTSIFHLFGVVLNRSMRYNIQLRHCDGDLIFLGSL
jgi:hypothetical protein